MFFARLAILFLSVLVLGKQSLAAESQALGSGTLPVMRFKVQTVTEHLIEGKDISFKRFPIAAGLSQTRVANIVQDGNGFLWMGTQYGLNRYDGYRSKVFKHEPGHSDSLSCVYIHGLFVDHSGVLWVGCDKFLDRFKPMSETFTHYPVTTDIPGGLSNPIGSIYEDRLGLLWLTTSNGLFKFDPKTAHCTRYVHQSTDPTSISSNQINFVSEDRRGRLWIATDGGLDEFDRKIAKVIWHLPFEEAVAKVHEDKSNVLWMIMSFSPSCPVATLDRESKLVTCYRIGRRPHLAESPVIISGILESEEGTIWLSSTRGLFKFDREGNRIIRYHSNPSDAESLESNNIISVFQDQEGYIWTCFQDTAPNVFSEKPPAFETFTYQRGNIASPLVTTTYKDHNGALWIGSMGGLNRIDRRTGKDILTPGFGVNNEILCILEDRSGILFGGTFHHELKRLDPQTGALSPYVLTDPSSPIMRIIFDHEGNLWAATYSGVSRLDRTTPKFVTYTPEKQYMLPYIEIKEDDKGIIWLGSAQSGLHRFDPHTAHFTVFEHNVDDLHSLSDNRVNSIQLDRSNNMWVGTQNGLDKFDPGTGRFETYSDQDGLAGNVVSCILKDRRGKLWMSTNKGVSSFDPQSNTFRNFSTADGLSGPDLTGWGACYESPDGEMFFGGFNGATAFYPSRLVNSSLIPRIVLTDFRLSGKSVSISSGSPLTRSITYTKAIRLSHKQTIFSIEFAALSFFNSTTNRYRYKLEGLQQQWIEVNSENRTASYTTLPTGAYTFRVQGATRGGSWSEPGAALAIEILPPWWSTWSFRTLCSVLIVVLAWFGYRYRVHQLTHQYNLRLEERVLERTRIARELHDTLLQTVQGAKIVADSALDEPGEFNRVHAALERISDWLARATLEGRAAVSSLRGSFTQTSDLVSALQQADHDCNDGSIAFTTILQGKTRDLYPLIGNEVCRIGCEAIQNACRHSNGTKVRATLYYARDLVLRVEDDGVGISSELVSNGREDHFGLQGMRERAERIGAKLNFKSKVAGTEVELIVPGRLAYRKGSDG